MDPGTTVTQNNVPWYICTNEYRPCYLQHDCPNISRKCARLSGKKQVLHGRYTETVRFTTNFSLLMSMCKLETLHSLHISAIWCLPYCLTADCRAEPSKCSKFRYFLYLHNSTYTHLSSKSAATYILLVQTTLSNSSRLQSRPLSCTSCIAPIEGLKSTSIQPGAWTLFLKTLRTSSACSATQDQARANPSQS
jgi:hypothetical protein